jgi:hypothetical protein
VRAYSGAVNHHSLEKTMDYTRQLQRQEYEARRLRAEYARDPLIRTVIALDLAIRRAACRVLSLAGACAARLSGAR